MKSVENSDKRKLRAYLKTFYSNCGRFRSLFREAASKAEAITLELLFLLLSEEWNTVIARIDRAAADHDLHWTSNTEMVGIMERPWLNTEDFFACQTAEEFIREYLIGEENMLSDLERIQGTGAWPEDIQRIFADVKKRSYVQLRALQAEEAG